jgi:hypothetical protein
VHRVQADEAKEAGETFLLLEVATVEVSDNEDEQDTEGLPEAVPVSGAPGEWELTYPCDIERGQVLKFVLDGHVRQITAGISAQAGHTITLCCNDGGSEGGAVRGGTSCRMRRVTVSLRRKRLLGVMWTVGTNSQRLHPFFWLKTKTNSRRSRRRRKQLLSTRREL